MSGSMWNLDGWEQITCDERDRTERPHISSSLSDLDGVYGEPVIFTEWCGDDEAPVLRDYRWPGSDRKCEHYAPAARPCAPDGEGGA